jgi:hypothetical protein
VIPWAVYGFPFERRIEDDLPELKNRIVNAHSRLRVVGLQSLRERGAAFAPSVSPTKTPRSFWPSTEFGDDRPAQGAALPVTLWPEAIKSEHNAQFVRAEDGQRIVGLPFRHSFQVYRVHVPHCASKAAPTGIACKEPDDPGVLWPRLSSYGMTATQIVDCLLDERTVLDPIICEASVYRPPRSTRWVAVFTGAEPGRQIRKSTGLTNREAALVLARKWERDARQERERLNAKPKKPTIRARSNELPGLMTQSQVAAALGMSERGVRQAERRALSKLRNDPALREFWKQH